MKRAVFSVLGWAAAALLAAQPAAADTRVAFDLVDPAAGPFPSDAFTVADAAQLTGLRVQLPKPDCAARPNDCADIDVLNQLDGFNMQPRLRLRFDGPLDPTSVNRSALFLVKLEDASEESESSRRPVHRIGVNNAVFDVLQRTLFAESDELLEQHTRYALIATRALRDARGERVSGDAFREFLAGGGSRGERRLREYRRALQGALAHAGVNPRDVVAASVFTTQSATAVLEKIRRQIKRARPERAEFAIGSRGERAVFPLREVERVIFQREVEIGGVPAAAPLPLEALAFVPGAVGAIAFGRYASPDYETPRGVIPAVATRSGIPQPERVQPIYFNLFLPSRPRPDGGWPIAIFGHFIGDSKQGEVLTIAASLAERGIASICINAVGSGGGAGGSLAVQRAGGAPEVVVPAGGRGVDQNGDGRIEPTEGAFALPPEDRVTFRDALRQTVVDLMQLVRVIETGGLDVDGDARGDFDPDRIFYVGHALGGVYGAIFAAVEPDLRAVVLGVAQGSSIETSRLSPVFRPLLLAPMLGARVPSLLNALPAAAPLFGADDDWPLRDQPLHLSSVRGAAEIGDFIENTEWAGASGDALAYAPHLRRAPLAGNRPKPLIYAMAQGDLSVPNPLSSALIRAGDFADRVTLFRHDLFIDRLLVAGEPPAVINALLNPHFFSSRISGPTAPYARGYQRQVARFFASGGAVTLDPDGPGPIFETPISLPLPEQLGFRAPVE